VLIDIDSDYNNFERDFHELPPYIVAMLKRRTPPRPISMRINALFSVIFLLVLLQVTQRAANAQTEKASPRVLVHAFGAIGDGKHKDTAAFQKALDTCEARGGTVVVEPGNYLIGSIQLHANTTLVLQKNAIVTGSPSADDYPLIPVRFEGAIVQGHRALIYADHADNIAIIGPGSLVGDNKIGNLRNPRGPLMVELANCNNVELNGFTVRYRRLWSIHVLFCNNVVAQNLTIRSTPTLSNGDGIDVDSSTHIIIENCDIDTGDDSISLKSGRGLSAVRLARPTEDVLIRNCSLASAYAGIGIGTEMSGGIRDVQIENCAFPKGANAIYIKSRTGRGGFFTNITGEYLRVSARTLLGVSLRDIGIIGIDPVSGKDGIPQASKIAFDHIAVDCQTLVDASRILPIKPIDGLSLSNITGKSRRGITLANAEYVALSNIKVSETTGPFLQTRDVSGTGLDGAVALRVPMMEDPDQLRKAFDQPPDDTRPMVRWWWFGPAVTKPQLQKQLDAMKKSGFGGFEVQPTYPLALDGSIPGLVNLKFLSPEFLDDLNFVAEKAKEMGLRMDLTIGSGWPYGGPTVSLDDSAGRLRAQRVSGGDNESAVDAPQLRPGDTVLAAFDDSNRELPVKDNSARISTTQPTKAVTYFISGHTGMKVKRPAFGAEGYVLDHQTAAAVQRFIASVAEKEVAACGVNPPYAIFCDSLESYGENWTEDFLNEFQKRRGYDLRPLLPALVTDIGPKTPDIRHDWAKTLTELLNDNFVKPMRNFAEKHDTRFRIQAYGQPAAGLYTYLNANLPEGEGYQWHDYRATRYASSACHLLGIPVSSSETFTWVHTQPFRATPLDIKAEADLHFLQGVNQIICHGWPYTPPGVGFPGWSFYAAGVFDDQNPWNIVMPDVTRYLQRVSFILRQGVPANDIALYLSNSDAWARFAPGDGARLHNSLTDEVGDCLGHEIVGDILDAGYNLDFFDDGILDARGSVDTTGTLIFGGRGDRSQFDFGRPTGARYHAVILAGVERMPLSTLRKLADFADRGGTLIATRRLPSIVPGFKSTDADQKTLHDIIHRLFDGPDAPGIFVPDESQIAQALTKDKKIRPDVQFSPASPDLGFVRRSTDGAAFYFVANTSNQPKDVTANFRFESITAQQLDPISGKITPLQILGHPENYTTVKLDLAPYASTILLFSNRMAPVVVTTQPSMQQTVDISSGWTVSLRPDQKPVPMNKLHSWTDDDATRSFSGVATYFNHISVSPDLLSAGRISIDFGDGSPTPAAGRRAQGYAAELNAPVRDAAVVYVNDKPAGSVWCAPFRLDITDLLKPYDNNIRVDVANTAVNYLASNGFPNYDYSALVRVFGPRFTPAAAAQYKPLPSGLLGPIKLVASE
jgi:hypothetical protein